MADIAIFRINYKSDFILTLQSDAGWLTPFCIKFWTGAPSQAYFVGFDGTTYTHCAPVEGDPQKIVVQFDDHHLPIGDLKFQIGYHFTVADFPTSVEDEVINQAAVIIDNDGERQQVMLDFNGETAPEIEFALPAYANEAQRIANEQARIAAEEQRVSNEQQRISNEEDRISAEESRQEHELQRIRNEETRITEFTGLKADAIAATGAANDAATFANDKAALAQQKADYAQAQGDYAKAQGDIALADHKRAETDHERAEADHDTATDDHTTATIDHTQAESDHTRAESDHTRAESDHAAVEVYVDSLGAFDISAYHATGSVLAKYADLTDAIGIDGANIPETLRKGGMSVKFVQSSDNKYVQYRLMADTFSTIPSDWQGVDEEPTAGSDNLVKSGGVFSKYAGVPQYFYNTNNGLYGRIKEIYLEGIDTTKQYEVWYCRYYNSQSAYQIIIRAYTQPDKSDAVRAFSDLVTNINGVVKLENYQGYVGNAWVVLTMTENDTSTASGEIDLNVACNLNYSPAIKESFDIANGNAVTSRIDNEVTQLSSEVNDYTTHIRPSLRLRTPSNLLYNLVDGFIEEDGSVSTSSRYKHTQKIPVNEGDIITLWDLRSETNPQSLSAMRFVCAYSNGVAQESKGSGSNTGSYTVPSGIDEIVVSVSISYFDAPYKPMLIIGSVAPRYYVEPVSPMYEAAGDLLPDKLMSSFKNGFWRTAKASVTNDTLILAVSNLVKNVSYFFTGKFSSFTSLIIGHKSSKPSYYATCGIYTNVVDFDINGHVYSYEHGLTISDYINVTMVENDNSRISVIIETSGGQVYTKTIGWDGFGRNGSYRATINGTMNDVVFAVTCKDLKNAPIHIYGDSYIAVIESTEKWTHWLVTYGYGDNFMLNAFPGANADDLLVALKTNLGISTPRIILWACGMNDGADTDANTPNANWLAKIEQVLLICEQNEVEPVLCTIPSVPSILHEAKNTWVRNSGYRYVDIAKAVGATSAGVWFSGMLKEDGVHPTELGAVAISRRVCCDLPDIIFNK